MALTSQVRIARDLFFRLEAIVDDDDLRVREILLQAVEADLQIAVAHEGLHHDRDARQRPSGFVIGAHGRGLTRFELRVHAPHVGRQILAGSDHAITRERRLASTVRVRLRRVHDESHLVLWRDSQPEKFVPGPAVFREVIVQRPVERRQQFERLLAQPVTESRAVRPGVVSRWAAQATYIIHARKAIAQQSFRAHVGVVVHFPEVVVAVIERPAPDQLCLLREEVITVLAVENDLVRARGRVRSAPEEISNVRAFDFRAPGLAHRVGAIAESVAGGDGDEDLRLSFRHNC